MELALYDPEFGYYARAAQTIRPRGRFFYQRRRRPAVRRAPRDPARRDGRHSRDDHRRAAEPRSRRQTSAQLGRTRVRPRRSRRRQRPPVRRHPARGATPRSRLLRAHPAAPGRGERRGARRAAGDARRGRPIASPRRGPRCPRRSKACSSPTSCSTRCRSTRSSCATTACARCTSIGRRFGPRRAHVRCHARGPAVDAGARRRISIGSASTLEPGWRAEINLRARRLDPRRGAAAAARLHHPHRLRPRRARAVLG